MKPSFIRDVQDVIEIAIGGMNIMESVEGRERGGTDYSHLMHFVAGRLTTEQRRDVAPLLRIGRLDTRAFAPINKPSLPKANGDSFRHKKGPALHTLEHTPEVREFLPR